MTDEQINEAIAEKVMGLAPCNCEKNIQGYSVFQYDKDTGGCNFCGNGPTPDFLLSPGASKQLREKLMEKWDTSQSFRRRRSFTFIIWNQDQIEEYRATADTEERAVALCALRSVGVTLTPSPQ